MPDEMRDLTKLLDEWNETVAWWLEFLNSDRVVVGIDATHREDATALLVLDETHSWGTA